MLNSEQQEPRIHADWQHTRPKSSAGERRQRRVKSLQFRLPRHTVCFQQTGPSSVGHEHLRGQAVRRYSEHGLHYFAHHYYE